MSTKILKSLGLTLAMVVIGCLAGVVVAIPLLALIVFGFWLLGVWPTIIIMLAIWLGMMWRDIYKAVYK